MKNQKGFTLVEVFVAVVAITMFGGWAANIVKLVGVGFAISQWGGMEVARAVGIFVAPLGAVLGFF